MVENLPPVRDRQRSASSDRKMQRDLRTLVRFVSVYCKDRHGGRSAAPLRLKLHDLEIFEGHDVDLCPECTKLLAHALVKRSRCPLQPKPACKRCPNHCYRPKYREEIRRVMRYSGRELLLSGRLDYLLHLLL